MLRSVCRALLTWTGTLGDTIYSDLAQQLQQSGRTAEAEISYRKALESDSDNVIVLNNLGVLLREKGDWQEARELYQRAVESNSSFGAAHANLGHLNYQKGNVAEAVANLQQAVVLGHEATHGLLGSGLRQLGQFIEAEHSLRIALSSSAQDKVIRTELIGLLRQVGRVLEADGIEYRSRKSSFTTPDKRNVTSRMSPLDGNLHAITAYTDSHVALERLLHSADQCGIPLWIIGAGDIHMQGGASGNMRALRVALEQVRDDDALILMASVGETLFAPDASAQLMRSIFDEMSAQIVFASDADCDENVCTQADKFNPAVYMGRVGALRLLMMHYPWQHPPSDQEWWIRMDHKGAEFSVDVDCRLFACFSQSWRSLVKDSNINLHQPPIIYYPRTKATLLAEAYQSMFPEGFSVRSASSSLPRRGVMGNSKPGPAAIVTAGALVGAPLREGPWQCSQTSVWNSMQAAVCKDDRILVHQVYVANMDSRGDRMQSVDAELRKHGLRALRYPSIVGSHIPQDEVRLHSTTAFRALPLGHLGCFYTHVALWREVASRGWNNAWILEDDATFVSDQLQQLPERLAEIQKLDPDWHFLYTGRNAVGVSRALLMHEGVLKHWPDRHDRRMSAHIVDAGISEGLWGYIISAKGATVLVEAFEKILAEGLKYDIDFALHLEYPRNDLRMYALEPSLSGQAMTDRFSDTSAVSRGRKQLLLGHQFLGAGKYEEAEVWLRGSVENLQTSNIEEPVWLQEATRYLAVSRAQQSKIASDTAASEAEIFFRQAAEMAEVPAISRALPSTLADLCYFLSSKQRYSEAKQLCQRSIQLSHERSDATTESTAYEYLAMLYEFQGNLNKAEKAFRRAISVTQGGGAKEISVCNTYMNFCVFLWKQRRLSEAEALCEHCEAMGHSMHVADVLKRIRAEAKKR